MPILKPDALDYIAGTKIPKLRSMVLCLEDALLENDVLEGMNILEKTLIRIGQVKRDSTETRFPLGCCHVKFLWLERSAARGYSGDTGRNFPCIESFEPMVANCLRGAATGRN
ncbi:HpcH/HpaI aldolase/citrate lyase family protein (plasmid) [Rhizobium leguminosarum]|nr:HpcH/HpaI aldolase/citrate lyase family protein [Rhizobium leguminosarum]UIK01500.1 HpcH/HpaI aldolase/citrate lyase family protein [Rhizobium leguminosarum]UIK01502.1 HpcH/HpaI aldolase/citrate lyase family protein [Rhizobium leguminosarum]UIK14394.1 HpcH/HpaI aldolase/citrate lyase family protein [Rhizobium leguminosarum]UIK14397.1 HpcH/HpaI aldolase/citrate lyase family protein [Rhizobium leguminosarum]UIL30519.1 HpcH/HpaI aldolase/citrate lyase family protein [Rhizobium leguminosarum]